MTACKACGAPIWWARTTHDRRIPINVRPDPRGVLVLASEDGTVLEPAAIDESRQRDGYVIVVKDDQFRWAPRWTSHFATCPQVDQFRKDPRGSGTLRGA